VLECGNDIVVVVRRYMSDVETIGVEVVNGDRKGWPDTQISPDGCSRFASKTEVEAARR
jgi:hypothetical protein